MRPRFAAGVLVALAALALLGCASGREQIHGPEVGAREESVDARYDYECDVVSGRSVCVMTGNALLPLAPRYPMITLGAVKNEKAGVARYFLRVVAINQGTFVDIPRGKSLRLTIDGVPLDLAGDGSSANRMAGEAGKRFEAAIYAVPPELLARIGGARSVTARVQGATAIEKRFGPVNQAYFAMFMRKYMGGAPAGK
ncbi:MAG TPA: hypothetical protein VN317_10825 [Candidatus Methanoperedens sp.]|nr:hypothetical protein [Candidatus Methanoperedens sp.]